MTDDFSPLTQPDHWLGWLGDNPSQMVRDAIEESLQQQVLTAHLEWVRLLGEAEFLTGGKKIPNEPTKMMATRAALGVEFELEVSSDHGIHQLRGVFSWVTIGLDEKRHDRTFLALDVDMEWAAEMLRSRIYDWDVFGKPNSDEAKTQKSANKDSPVDEQPTQSKRPWHFWRK